MYTHGQGAHKVTWDYDVLEAEARTFVATCVARDVQRAAQVAQINRQSAQRHPTPHTPQQHTHQQPTPQQHATECETAPAMAGMHAAAKIVGGDESHERAAASRKMGGGESHELVGGRESQVVDEGESHERAAARSNAWDIEEDDSQLAARPGGGSWSISLVELHTHAPVRENSLASGGGGIGGGGGGKWEEGDCGVNVHNACNTGKSDTVEEVDLSAVEESGAGGGGAALDAVMVLQMVRRGE